MIVKNKHAAEICLERVAIKNENLATETNCNVMMVRRTNGLMVPSVSTTTTMVPSTQSTMASSAKIENVMTASSAQNKKKKKASSAKNKI